MHSGGGMKGWGLRVLFLTAGTNTEAGQNT